jgi:hypothetical protein
MIGKLYHDRLSNTDDAMDTCNDGFAAVVLQTSEKRMVDRLFAREKELRQAQAVVDWLEQVTQQIYDLRNFLYICFITRKHDFRKIKVI